MFFRFPHHDPAIFPDPEAFKPERWLVGPSEAAELDKYLTPFSRGPRSCPAPNLAYAELYLAYASVFRKIDLVDRDDVSYGTPPVYFSLGV